MWLKTPVEETDKDGRKQMTGGKHNKQGTPQGGVISPLLANLYMNRFLKHWRLSGRCEALRAQVVSYADDFVILSRGHAAEALTWTKAVMTKLGLELNEAKTSLKDARRESFDFLGYTLGPRRFPNGGRRYLGAAPSKKSVLRIKRKVSDLLRPGNKGAWPEVQVSLNAFWVVGRLTSATALVPRLIRLLIGMSSTECSLFFADDIMRQAEASDGSPMRFMGSPACSC